MGAAIYNACISNYYSNKHSDVMIIGKPIPDIDHEPGAMELKSTLLMDQSEHLFTLLKIDMYE